VLWRSHRAALNVCFKRAHRRAYLRLRINLVGVCLQARNIDGQLVYGQPQHATWFVRSVLQSRTYNSGEAAHSCDGGDEPVQDKGKAAMTPKDLAREELELRLQFFEHKVQEEANGSLAPKDARAQVTLNAPDLLHMCKRAMRSSRLTCVRLFVYHSCWLALLCSMLRGCCCEGDQAVAMYMRSNLTPNPEYLDLNKNNEFLLVCTSTRDYKQ
jgi:hypothetical protein